MPNGGIEHTDHTATIGFETAGQNVISIEVWQCPHCLRRLGEKGRASAVVNVITAERPDKWCMECYLKGVKEGICIKAKKLSKKERKRLRKG